MRIFLLHGMGRTPLSLRLLGCRLRRAGHPPSYFRYGVARAGLRHTADRFAAHVRTALAAAGEEGAGYAVLGHSLGNVVARLASPSLPPGFRRFVMLAPPNRPATMARLLRRNPLYRLATGEAGQRLADRDFFAALPTPAVPTLVVAGTRGPRARWWPFRGAPNDAVLGVDEARLAGVPLFEVPGIHTFLMNRRDVFLAVAGFLAAEEAAGPGGGVGVSARVRDLSAAPRGRAP